MSQIVLSLKERDVLSRASRGETAKETARAISSTEATVKVHRRNVTLKLGARNITHAVAEAFRRGQLS